MAKVKVNPVLPPLDPPSALPPHREDGTLPIFRHGVLREARDTSPFRIGLLDLVERFATSKPRVALLHGFFAFRGRLAEHGIVEGFQWIGGSFIERRPHEPADIDVVTFFLRPAHWRTKEDELSAVRGDPSVFDSKMARARYGCDAFFVDMQHTEFLPWLCQWYAVYSHDKATSGMQKGFVQIPLTLGDETQVARALLDARQVEHDFP
jgi:hypothetical protein